MVHLFLQHPEGELDIPHTPDQRWFEGNKGGITAWLCVGQVKMSSQLPAPKLASACSPQEFCSWKQPSWLATANPAPLVPPFPALSVWGMWGTEGLQQPYTMNSSGYSASG